MVIGLFEGSEVNNFKQLFALGGFFVNKVFKSLALDIASYDIYVF